MRIIVPMAGRGSRLRPQTHTVPKPLLPLAGQTLVQRIVREVAQAVAEPIERVSFVSGRFGDQALAELARAAQAVGAQHSVHYQDEPLGTAHAILQAADDLEGPVVVAFADTLFHAEFQLDLSHEASIWVQQVEDPSAYGVVRLDAEGYVQGFVEKPREFVSDLAIIGIYYFRDGQALARALKLLVESGRSVKGEFLLTDALEDLRLSGTRFATSRVSRWMDCGNADAVLRTHAELFATWPAESWVSPDSQLHDAVIVPPVRVEAGAVLRRSVVGPNVSIGAGTVVEDSILADCIIQDASVIRGQNLRHSMIGSRVRLEARPHALNLGDDSQANS